MLVTTADLHSRGWIHGCLHLAEQLQCLPARDRRVSLQKVIDASPILEVLHERGNRNPRGGEYNVAAVDFRITRGHWTISHASALE
jgi:hypothetical protein